MNERMYCNCSSMVTLSQYSSGVIVNDCSVSLKCLEIYVLSVYSYNTIKFGRVD